MKKRFTALVAGLFFFTFGCADIDDGKKLESITVIPDYWPVKINSRPKQFIAIGYYSDDSEEDITSEVTWSDDATGDAMISAEYPGLVYFRQSGWFAVIAKHVDVTADTEVKGKADICVWSDASSDCPSQ